MPLKNILKFGIIPTLNTTVCKIKLVNYNSFLFTSHLLYYYVYFLFSNLWKKGRVVPVFKSEDKKKFRNYRPISILSAFSKVF